MNIWTKTELLELLEQWKKAYRAVASNKSYSFNGRTLTRQDAETIRKQIDAISRQIDALDNPDRGSVRAIPARTVR